MVVSSSLCSSWLLCSDQYSWQDCTDCTEASAVNSSDIPFFFSKIFQHSKMLITVGGLNQFIFSQLLIEFTIITTMSLENYNLPLYYDVNINTKKYREFQGKIVNVRGFFY